MSPRETIRRLDEQGDLVRVRDDRG